MGQLGVLSLYEESEDRLQINRAALLRCLHCVVIVLQRLQRSGCSRSTALQPIAPSICSPFNRQNYGSSFISGPVFLIAAHFTQPVFETDYSYHIAGLLPITLPLHRRYTFTCNRHSFPPNTQPPVSVRPVESTCRFYVQSICIYHYSVH